MAISFDATANSGAPAVSSSYSYSFTNAGDFLAVGVAFGGLATTVSGITYNGVALTLIEVKNSASNRRTELWGLVAPSVGTFNIAVTLSGVTSSASGAMSFTGVDQVTPSEADANASGTGTSDMSVAVTTVADNAWVVDCGSCADGSVTVGAGQTERVNTASGPFGSLAMSHEGPKTPAGSVTMSWSGVDSLLEWATVATALRPATSSGQATRAMHQYRQRRV